MLPVVSQPSDVLFDPGAAYPEFGPLRAALARRDWPAARTVLDGVPPQLRATMVWTCGSEQTDDGFLRGVLDADPADSSAAAMLAAHLIDVGWTIRSGRRAKHVTPEQFNLFHQWLRKAEAVLIEATARNPHDPTLWTQRMTSGRGLEVGQSEIRRRYDRVARIDAHHLAAQQQLVQQLCPKWGGTWEQVHTFARAAMIAAPPGYPQGMLVADAHIEQALDGDSPGLAEYLRQEPVRAQLYDAATRSVWHPDFRRWVGWVGAVSTFAMVFSVLGDQRAAGHLFGMLGNLATESPWYYLGDGDAVTQIRRYRQLALSGAGR